MPSAPPVRTDHTHLIDQLRENNGERFVPSEGDITLVEQVVNEITEVEENNTYIEQIIENNTFVLNVAKLDSGNGKLKTEQVPLDLMSVAIPFVIDGGGSAITTGVKGEIEIPFACALTGWSLLLDQSGSIVIDIWKDTYANYPPTGADSITASDKPTVSSATKAQDLAPTGWTTTVAAGDILRFNVDSVATATRATLSLRATKTV